ncbi:unnamed protein product [Taenia asiatica]|uniref:Ufd2P_core domain-containing protein n=1 Tax=Taenia asiatica TaxID=60517 RepID=A0A0R3WC49_TAEAS|nr:unnamed protein product [Taenia asiatica]
MADVEEVVSDASTSPMLGEHSPPVWNGPPPVFNLLEATRSIISIDMLLDQAGLRFEADLLTQNDDGDYCIPLPIAAPMLILREKAEEELQHGHRWSFFHRLTFPIIPRTNPPEILEEFLHFLFQTNSLEACRHQFATVSARILFELLVDLIQRVDSLSLPISYQTARAMYGVDLIKHKYGMRDDVLQQPIPEAAYVNLVTQDIIANDAFKRRIPNILHYLWFQDLQKFFDLQVKFVIQFIVINFMHILRRYCTVGGATTDGLEEGPFMVMDYAQMRADAMEEALRVLGTKLGKYLIRIPFNFYGEVAQELEINAFPDTVISGRFLVNLLLLNQPEVWSPLAELPSFINHDQPNCNFQAENCICESFRARFPQVVESLTTHAT